MARPKISEETKQKLTELRNSVTSVPADTPDTKSSSPAANVLGQIYDLMVAKRELELQNRKDEKSRKDKEDKEQDDFNDALMESLKPPKKKPTKKAEKPKKEKVKKKCLCFKTRLRISSSTK